MKMKLLGKKAVLAGAAITLFGSMLLSQDASADLRPAVVYMSAGSKVSWTDPALAYGSLDYSGNFVAYNYNYGSYSTVASYSTQSTPSVSSSSTTDYNYYGGPSGQSVMYYWFEIAGPENITIPVNIDAYLQISVGSLNVNSSSSANATFALGNSVGSVVFTNYIDMYKISASTSYSSLNGYRTGSLTTTDYLNTTTLDQSLYSEFAVMTTLDRHYDLQTNHVYTIEIIAGTTALNSTATAFADPYISIDPSFTGTGYSLNLSPNVGNDPASPVPEPATMLLFGTGIVGLAAVGRRKRS